LHEGSEWNVGFSGCQPWVRDMSPDIFDQILQSDRYKELKKFAEEIKERREQNEKKAAQG